MISKLMKLYIFLVLAILLLILPLKNLHLPAQASTNGLSKTNKPFAEMSASLAMAHSKLLTSLMPQATTGDLDPTFGTGGMATADFNGADDVAEAVALQPDGKIVLAGVVRRGPYPQGRAFGPRTL